MACDDATRDQLLTLCGLSAASLAPLAQGLFRLGCRAQPRPPAPASSASASSADTGPQLFMAPLIDPNMAARRLTPTALRASLTHTTPLERHSPLLGATLRDALASRLSTNDYPYLRGQPPSVGTFAAAAATGDAVYGPRGLGSWARHGRGEGGADATGAKPEAHRVAPLKRKLVVIMLGGSSHAELRCVHDVLGEQEDHGGDGGGGWEVYFGSTAVLTPLQYVRALSETPPPPPLATF